MKRVGIAFFLITVSVSAFAENEIKIYGGLQEASDSTAHIVDIDGSEYDLGVEWNGRSFELPPYFGLRYTQWVNDDWGIGAEYTHSKVYASQQTIDNSGYHVMQFTDGVNVFSLNATRRFQNESNFTPYVGIGIGINTPHVELQSPLMSRDEWEYNYQFGGLSATTFGGVHYDINDQWGVFSEIKLDHSQIDVDMGEEGSYQTDITTQAVNFGVSLSF